MLKSMFIAGAVLAAVPAIAQTSAPLNTTATAPHVTNPGGPGAANSGPGATGTVATEGTGAGTVSNNPAGAGNAQQPSRAGSTPSGGGSN